jgi:hypothetical protein
MAGSKETGRRKSRQAGQAGCNPARQHASHTCSRGDKRRGHLAAQVKQLSGVLTLDTLGRLAGRALRHKLLPPRQHMQQPEVASCLTGVSHALADLEQLGQALNLQQQQTGGHGTTHIDQQEPRWSG